MWFWNYFNFRPVSNVFASNWADFFCSCSIKVGWQATNRPGKIGGWGTNLSLYQAEANPGSDLDLDLHVGIKAFVETFSWNLHDNETTTPVPFSTSDHTLMLQTSCISTSSWWCPYKGWIRRWVGELNPLDHTTGRHFHRHCSPNVFQTYTIKVIKPKFAKEKM